MDEVDHRHQKQQRQDAPAVLTPRGRHRAPARRGAAGAERRHAHLTYQISDVIICIVCNFLSTQRKWTKSGPPPIGASWTALPPTPRSEEHTSELQSLRHLVCRLLLEKKKKMVP